MMIEKNDQNNMNEEIRNSQQDADNDYGLPEAEYSPIEREQQPVYEESPSYTNLHEEDEKGFGPEKKSSVLPIVLILAGIVVLAGIFVYLFAFDEDGQEQQVTQRQPEPAPVVIEEEAPEEVYNEEEWNTPAETPVVEGSVSNISSRTGRYYIIVGSFIDSDLANDYAGRLAKEGYQAKIIEPSGTRKFYRLSVKDAESINALQADMDSMKEKHGENIWIVKY